MVIPTVPSPIQIALVEARRVGASPYLVSKANNSPSMPTLSHNQQYLGVGLRCRRLSYHVMKARRSDSVSSFFVGNIAIGFMSKTLEEIRRIRYVESVVDGRESGNSITVTLKAPYRFWDDKESCIRSFDTVTEARGGCTRRKVFRTDFARL